MKMVSQLTKQAMSRHRLLSSVAYPDVPSPQAQTVHPLYSHPAPLPPAEDAPPVRSFTPTPAPAAAPLHTPPQRTIYGQLMKKHDQFTERHLNRS